MPVTLHPHQKEAVEELHNGCILYGGVGVGKTITSLAYYFTKVCGGDLNKWGSMRTPKDVYVITTAKVRDSKGFELQAAQYGVHTDPAISTNGVKIVVDSWNNLHKYVEISDAFFIFDEQRVVGYGAWSRAFIKVARANEWILLSATPGDTWLDYIPVFIANGWYKHKTDFTDQHVIWTPRVKYPKVLRYQNVGKLVRQRNAVLVHMPYERHTTRHSIDIACDYDQDKFDRAVKKRWHVYENRPLRDAAELFVVMRRIVNSDTSRISALRKIMSRHSKVIVFYNFDYELEMLRSLGETRPSSTKPESSTSTTEKSSLSVDLEMDPWDWLLSPEGMAANALSAEDLRNVDTSSADLSDAHSRSFAVAEWNGHRHQEIPETDRWLYLVQYRAGAEGWNCVDTNAVVFWSQTYSFRDWWQAHGRIDRLNTPFRDLYYYHLFSSSVIDKAIRKALKAKRNFNERDLAL